MAGMKLVSLTLTNFKGVKEFTLEANGKDVKVLGDNATGKTTLFDAFIWLLFDKDSQNKKDFQIKTVNQDGEVLHGLDHSVEATLEIDGTQTTLKKTFSEKWTKKRGQAEKQFTGHTTDYYINGVPSKKKEHADFVSGLVSEDIFKLLTSPSYFNEQMKWQDRRSILIEVCGDVTDEEVINSDDSLKELTKILDGRKIEDHRKIINSKRSEINKELERIPVRIDELQRSLPDTDELDLETLDEDINEQETEIENKKDEITNAKNGSLVAEKQTEVANLEGKLQAVKNDIQSNMYDNLDKLFVELNGMKDEYNTLTDRKNKIERTIKSHTEAIQKNDNYMKALREDWKEINAKEFSSNVKTQCPTCEQSLPKDQVHIAIEKAKEQFNKQKSNDLIAINTKGKIAKQTNEEMEETINDSEEELKVIKQDIENKKKSMTSVKEQIEKEKETITDISENEDYQAIAKQITETKETITQLKGSTSEEVEKLQGELSDIKNHLQNLKEQRSKFSQIDTVNKRVDELKEQERELSGEYEKLEHELYLTEEFIRTKVNLLEDKINSKFKFARFKLFEQQVNGGLNETCETLYKGVPYSKGLNNASKINVGLDILNTLSHHYEFFAPVFVDNSEAVTKLIDVDTQIISLVVSGNDKKLRTEEI